MARLEWPICVYRFQLCHSFLTYQQPAASSQHPSTLIYFIIFHCEPRRHTLATFASVLMNNKDNGLQLQMRSQYQKATKYKLDLHSHLHLKLDFDLLLISISLSFIDRSARRTLPRALPRASRSLGPNLSSGRNKWARESARDRHLQIGSGGAGSAGSAGRGAGRTRAERHGVGLQLEARLERRL